MNFFATHKHTHQIPPRILRQALILSPGKDWRSPDTDAYQFLKKWALEQDDRRAGKVPKAEPVVPYMLKDSIFNVFVTNMAEYDIPQDVMAKALTLSPGKDWKDKRTKAYKYLEGWALEQDKNNEKDS